MLRSTPPRSLLALFAVMTLVGACSSGSGGESADTTASTKADKTTTTTAPDETTTTTVDGGLGIDVCTLIDPADLEAVTGTPFEEQDGDETSCTYSSSSGAAISLNIADVREAPEAGYQGAQSSCDDGSVEEITLTDADAAFTCLVTGIPTVAALGADGYLAILTGDDPDESVDDASITDALVTILENAITAA